MRTRAWLAPIALLALVALGLAACSSNTNKTVANAATVAAQYTPTQVGGATATPAASPTVAWPGPAPKMTANITAIFPANGAKVTQASTRLNKNTQLGGVCADISFASPVQSIQWFRMAVDAKEVTAKLTVLVKADRKTGQICYAVDAGIPVGKHTAAVSVQDPSDTTGKILQIVAWAFEVV